MVIRKGTGSGLVAAEQFVWLKRPKPRGAA
jgi:hypothetical protein